MGKRAASATPHEFRDVLIAAGVSGDHTPAVEEIVVAYLRGGDVEALTGGETIWLDLDLGNDSRGDWAVLTTRDQVEIVAHNSGAEIDSVEVWDGSEFGDGNCGVVALQGRTLVYSGGLAPTYVPPGFDARRP